VSDIPFISVYKKLVFLLILLTSLCISSCSDEATTLKIYFPNNNQAEDMAKFISIIENKTNIRLEEYSNRDHANNATPIELLSRGRSRYNFGGK
jgi:hypothetical protein